jgi:hypothetical protein
MALLDIFLSEKQKIQKHQRRITDIDAQPEDREASARWLAENATPHALLALLSRFDMNLTQSLKDKSEKDFAYALLVNCGEATHRPLRAWLKQCKQIAVPLRMLGEMCGHDAAVDMVFQLLRIEFEKDTFNAKKKLELLVWLAEVPHGDCIELTAPFLKDFDEGVRIATAEVLIYQQNDAAREPLLQALTNEEEESHRLILRILDTFATRRWPVKVPIVNLVGDFEQKKGLIIKK